MTGYFLVSRAAFRLMKQQQIGGSMVFVASKNGLVASAGASAYCTAKAAEIHLARCVALEGAAIGVRVNVVNPDAVIRGSRIWDGKWKAIRTEMLKQFNQTGKVVTQLYDLEADPAEAHDLAAQFPEVVKALEAKMAAARLPNPKFPVAGLDPLPEGKAKKKAECRSAENWYQRGWTPPNTEIAVARRCDCSLRLSAAAADSSTSAAFCCVIWSS